jgi:hypothetical protein
MKFEGTISNGQIVVSAPLPLPEGTKVSIAVADDADELESDEIDPTQFEYPHPLAKYDREKEIALLRERCAPLKEGEGIDAFEFLKQLAIERGLPLEPGE